MRPLAVVGEHQLPAGSGWVVARGADRSGQPEGAATCRPTRCRSLPWPPASHPPKRIYAFAKDASCSVLLASDGEASEQLPACVRTAPGASPQASPCLGAPCSFAAADAADAADARCARGLQSLHRASGLRGFVQAVMGPPSAPLGALVVASQEPIEVDAAGGGW